MSIARAAGAFWLLTIISGTCAFFAAGSLATAAILVSTLCYLGATVLVYRLLKPVSARLSLVAALFSFAGCALSVLAAFHAAPEGINSLAFFGGHCFLVGVLIMRSTFLPRAVGALMTLAGLGWLTFVWPSLAKELAPFNMLPGIVGELTLSLWLLIKGVNGPAWDEAARALLETTAHQS